jgi:hypothetical protein
MNDPLTIAAWLAFGVAVLFVLGVVLWAILHRKSPPPAIYSAPTTIQPYSISRALDDLKYQHADLMIGQTLGTAHAADLGAKLGPLSAPKPPEAPKA